MKPTHYIFSLLLAILFICPDSAQSQSTMVVTAGMNISNIDFEGAKSYVGYYGGLRAQITIEGHFSVVSNLIYSQKGWQFEAFMNERAGTMYLHYLDLQLAGNYALTTSLSVDTGVELGRLLKTIRDPHIDLFDDLYQKGDFSLLVGLHYKILKSTSIDLKYLHGLSYLFNGEYTDANGNVVGEAKEGNLRVFQIGVSTDIINFKATEQ